MNQPNVLVLLPATARQVAYVVFGIIGPANGSALVGYAALSEPLPRPSSCRRR